MGEEGYGSEEEEEEDAEEGGGETAASVEEEAKRPPWAFPRLVKEMFDSFQPRYDQLLNRLSDLIAASPDVPQLYMLRSRLHAELDNPLAALSVTHPVLLPAVSFQRLTL